MTCLSVLHLRRTQDLGKDNHTAIQSLVWSEEEVLCRQIRCISCRVGQSWSFGALLMKRMSIGMRLYHYLAGYIVMLK